MRGRDGRVVELLGAGAGVPAVGVAVLHSDGEASGSGDAERGGCTRAALGGEGDRPLGGADAPRVRNIQRAPV